jgi:Fe2+ or Zn2+ uptake regulation protein
MPQPAPEADRSLLLREAGLRVTRPRLAVLDALDARPHAGADAVIAAVRETLPVSTQAVYDVLNTLAARGVVRRVQPAGSVARYELRTGDNHHHVVCRDCGAVTDVDCATGEAPCLDLPRPGAADAQHAPHLDGFAIDEAEVTWWGTCPACLSRTTESSTHPTARRDDA